MTHPDTSRSRPLNFIPFLNMAEELLQIKRFPPITE